MRTPPCQNKMSSHQNPIAHGLHSIVYKTYMIEKHIGRNKRLTLSEALRLKHQLFVYQHILRQQGWHIPECYLLEVNVTKDKVELRLLEQYIEGPTVTEVLKLHGTSYALKKIIPTLYVLTMQPTVPYDYGKYRLQRLAYGVDLKPDNIILYSKKTPFLVDTFAPKLLTITGNWRYYSSQFETLAAQELLVVTATREGVILRLLRLLGIDRHSLSVSRAFLQAGLSSREIAFLKKEITMGYPLLNIIYGKNTKLNPSQSAGRS